MKALVILIITFCTFNVYAVYAPEWERPISESVMDVEIGTGYYAGITMVRVVMTRKDHSEQATGIQVFLSDGHQMSFQVLEVEEGDCGSQKLIAQFISASDDVDVAYHIQMVLVKHAASMCQNVVLSSRAWEVKIAKYNSVSSVPVGELVLIGNPRPVYTVQGKVEHLL